MDILDAFPAVGVSVIRMQLMSLVFEVLPTIQASRVPENIQTNWAV